MRLRKKQLLEIIKIQSQQNYFKSQQFVLGEGKLLMILLDTSHSSFIEGNLKQVEAELFKLTQFPGTALTCEGITSGSGNSVSVSN